jgi:hypothetical protein
MIMRSLCWVCVMWPVCFLTMFALQPRLALSSQARFYFAIELAITLAFMAAYLFLYRFRCLRCNKRIFGGSSFGWPPIPRDYSARRLMGSYRWGAIWDMTTGRTHCSWCGHPSDQKPEYTTTRP